MTIDRVRMFKGEGSMTNPHRRGSSAQRRRWSARSTSGARRAANAVIRGTLSTCTLPARAALADGAPPPEEEGGECFTRPTSRYWSLVELGTEAEAEDVVVEVVMVVVVVEGDSHAATLSAANAHDSSSALASTQSSVPIFTPRSAREQYTIICKFTVTLSPPMLLTRTRTVHVST